MLFTPSSPSTFIAIKGFEFAIDVRFLALFIEYPPALVNGENPLLPSGGYLEN